MILSIAAAVLLFLNLIDVAQISEWIIFALVILSTFWMLAVYFKYVGERKAYSNFANTLEKSFGEIAKSIRESINKQKEENK